MNHSGKSSTKSMTRRSILKLPVLCWLTSLFGGSAAATAPAAETAGTGGSLARRAISLNGAWSLTYGPLTEYPQKSPGTTPPAEWRAPNDCQISFFEGKSPSVHMTDGRAGTKIQNL